MEAKFLRAECSRQVLCVVQIAGYATIATSMLGKRARM